MKLLITGATGMVGSETVRQALSQPQWTEILLLVRRSTGIKDARIKEIIHNDFMQYDAIKNELSTVQACIWCLGIPQAWATKEEYHIITYEYTLSAAKALQNANPAAHFVFVSGGGADTTEKSRVLFAREKGMAENALKRLQLQNLTIARPGGIYPIVKPTKVPFAYKLFYPIFPLMILLAPRKVITSVELAQTLLYIAARPGNSNILENSDLKHMYYEEVRR